MKKSEEYLAQHNILPTNPNAVRIMKLVEKHPNYELFFLKSHFGKEGVPVEEIERVFKTIQEKNLKVAKSVDHYVKYVVHASFEQEVYDDKGNKKKLTFKSGQDITETIRFVHKENRVNIQQLTNFEQFSDEVRDSMTRLAANKIIQQFPAAGKKVVEDLTGEEKQQFYFNLDQLLNTNTRYLVITPIIYKIENEDGEEVSVKHAKDQKLTIEQFDKVPSHLKKFAAKFTEKPLQAFIKKSARYRSKEALFADLNAALNSLSGDEEYRKTIELVEDTEGAILEGLNPKKGIIVASALNAEAYKRIGGDRTNHCIRTQSTFASYQKFGGKQYLIVNSKLEPSNDYRILGLTIDGQGNITNAHTKSDVNIRGGIDNLLKEWGVREYVKPMTDDEIIEMLYVVIADESIFSSQEKGEMVIKFLPKLDPTRFDKRKMLNLIRFTRQEAEMKRIIRLSLESKTTEEFLHSYDYLSHSILKMVSDDKQAHEIVINFVKEFNDTVGIDKDSCLRMLLNKSKFVQPNRLIVTVGKGKFSEFVRNYTVEQEEQILNDLPQLFIYFLRDREIKSSKEMAIILKSLYAYEKRPDLRKVVLDKMKANGQFKIVTKKDLKDYGVYDKIAEDDQKDQTLLSSIQ